MSKEQMDGWFLPPAVVAGLDQRITACNRSLDKKILQIRQTLEEHDDVVVQGFLARSVSEQVAAFGVDGLIDMFVVAMVRLARLEQP